VIRDKNGNKIVIKRSKQSWSCLPTKGLLARGSSKHYSKDATVHDLGGNSYENLRRITQADGSFYYEEIEPTIAMDFEEFE